MARIEDLPEDILQTVSQGTDKLSDEDYEEFGRQVAAILKQRLAPSNGDPEFTLRMSNIGSPCVRKLFLENHRPEQREELNPVNHLKFMYGDITELLLLFLTKASGHDVQGEQDELTIAGIKGHRDCVIDGLTVDVKSASSFGYKKFKDHTLEQDDPFGYIVQLNSYMEAGQDDDKVTDKDRGAFLAFDKSLGHICIDIHDRKNWDLETAYERRKKIVNGDTLPERAFDDEPDGKSGNRKLGTFCAYCDVKNECWEGLRTFLSSKGPLHLTNVEREPRMPEIINGEIISYEDRTVEKA